MLISGHSNDYAITKSTGDNIPFLMYISEIGLIQWHKIFSKSSFTEILKAQITRDSSSADKRIYVVFNKPVIGFARFSYTGSSLTAEASYTTSLATATLASMHQVTTGNSKDLYISYVNGCLLYTSPSPRDLSTSRMPSSA